VASHDTCPLNMQQGHVILLAIHLYCNRPSPSMSSVVLILSFLPCLLYPDNTLHNYTIVVRVVLSAMVSSTPSMSPSSNRDKREPVTGPWKEHDTKRMP
jgi:hypothetical protein